MIETETKNLHTHVDIVTRGKGHRVIAKAAYNARDKLKDERYGETQNYSNLKDLVYSKVYLPDHVPERFSDREYLWNDVERFEKSSNSQLARNLIFAIPRELSEDDRIRLIEEFVKENFTDKGMIADVNIHNPDASDGLEQPHAHILLTLRRIDKNGKWLSKCKKEYVLDENGERIKLPSGNWKSKRVDLTDWNRKEKAKEWRENFSELANKYLEENRIDKRIDPRTFKEQGREEIPTIHMGNASIQMEKKGVKTERGNINRKIIEGNKEIKSLNVIISNIGKWIAELKDKVIESIKRVTEEKQTEYKKDPSLFDIYSYLEVYNLMQTEKRNQLTGKDYQRKSYFDAKTDLKTLAYMSSNNVKTILDIQMKKDELVEKNKKNKADIKALEKEDKSLDVLLKQANIIAETKKVYKEYESKGTSILSKITGQSKEEFYEKHKVDIDRYRRARAIIKKKTGVETSKPNEWKKMKDSIGMKLNRLEFEKKDLKEEGKTVNHIYYLVDQVNKELGFDIKIELDIEIEKAIARGEKPSTLKTLERIKKEHENRKGKEEIRNYKRKEQER